jgi:predicted nucleotidyltransferase
MTTQALNLAKKIENLPDSDIDFLLDFLRRRHSKNLLKIIDNKLAESQDSPDLNEAEAKKRLSNLGLS